MTYRRLSRVLHVTLLLAATFALVEFGLLLIKSRAAVVKLQYTIENANRTIIIAGAGLREIRLSEEAQIRQFTDTQKQITAVIQDLRRSVNNTSRNVNENVLPSVTMTVRSLNDSIQAFRGQTSRAMDDTHTNLLLLADTQRELNQKIATLDVKSLESNLNQLLVDAHPILVTGQETNKHIEHMVAYTDEKYTGKKTLWGKIKGDVVIGFRVAWILFRP